jgi:hypothetical protein
MFDALPRWLVLTLVAVLWVVVALRTGLSMRGSGRRWWVWFLVSLVFTAIPAAVVAWADYLRQRRAFCQAGQDEPSEEDDEPPPGDAQARRCEHCHLLLEGMELPHVAGRDTCPRCSLPLSPDQA